jgi:hypothetical protein
MCMVREQDARRCLYCVTDDVLHEEFSNKVLFLTISGGDRHDSISHR